MSRESLTAEHPADCILVTITHMARARYREIKFRIILMRQIPTPRRFYAYPGPKGADASLGCAGGS